VTDVAAGCIRILDRTDWTFHQLSELNVFQVKVSTTKPYS